MNNNKTLNHAMSYFGTIYVNLLTYEEKHIFIYNSFFNQYLNSSSDGTFIYTPNNDSEGKKAMNK